MGKAKKFALRLGIVSGAAILVLVALFGSTVVDLIRLQSAFNEAEEASRSEPGAYQLAKACAPCHGNTGNSLATHYPSLAGLPSEYIVEQLAAFASGARQSPIMAPFAMSLSNEQRTTLAQFYAARNVEEKPAFAVVSASSASASITVCESCHGAKLLGNTSATPHVPRLAGQGAEYLNKQLWDYKRETRVDSTGVMKAIAQGLSDDDIERLATTISQMPATN